MQKVLYFFPYDPFPEDSGAAKRCNQILRAIKDLGVDADVAFASAGSRGNAEAVRRKVSASYGVRAHEYKLWSPDYRVGSVVEYALRRTGYARGAAYTPFTSPFLATWFSRLVSKCAPDVLLMSYSASHILRYGRKYRGIRGVIDAIDLLSSYTRQLQTILAVAPTGVWDVAKLPDDLFRDDFYESARATDPKEFQIYDKYGDTLAISRGEDEAIRQGTTRTRVTYLPATQEAVSIQNSYDGCALFTMRGHPFNLHGYAQFVRRILPPILEECHEFNLRVVGNGCARVTTADGVELVGHVDNLRGEYQRSRFFVNPISGGTGQQLKLLEAMAHGLPAIAFARAAQASPIVHEETGLIARSSAEFSEHVVRLWRDRELCRRLGKRAREYVAAEFGDARTVESLGRVLLTS